MSPKTATISLSLALAFITLALTLTLSSAKSSCGTNTVAELLKEYNLPPGLFPNNVRRFSCIAFGPYPIKNVILSIELEDACKVTVPKSAGFANVIEFQPQILARISDRQLAHVQGLAVKLTAKSPPLDLHLTVSEIKVFQFSHSAEFIQFYSDSGVNSPPLPVSLLPPSPPSCDAKPSSDDIVAKILPFVA